MKKVAIFQSDLKMGGIQKSLLNLLEHIDYEKYQVDLYLFSKDQFFKKALPHEVHVKYLNGYPKICKVMPFSLLYHITRVNIKKKYDLAIDFNSYQMDCAIYALKCTAKKRVIWCHNDVVLKRKEEWKYRILFHAFKKKYRYFDTIACVSNGVKMSIESLLPYVKDKTIVIPNYINVEEIKMRSDEKISFKVDHAKYNLVSMGRLTKQKGFDLLLDLIYEVVQTRDDIHLYIIGDGLLKAPLEDMILKLQLEKYVTLLGSIENPFPYLKEMDAFILTSRYEGQGMVLLEAKALGLPLFFPERLERYNEGLKGTKNLKSALLKAKRNKKRPSDLKAYNEDVMRRFYEL